MKKGDDGVPLAMLGQENVNKVEHDQTDALIHKRKSVDDMNMNAHSDGEEDEVMRGEQSVMMMKSRSGRRVKPKMHNDGSICLVGSLRVPTDDHKTHVDIGQGGSNDSSAYDSTSPMSMNSQDQEHLAFDNRTHSTRSSRLSRHKKVHMASRRNHTKKSAGSNGGGGGGGIFKAAAVAVLQQEKRLMTTGDIAKLALKRGLVKCSGKTPEATMASALYTDIKKREGESIFIRPREGLFGLREWEPDYTQEDCSQETHVSRHENIQEEKNNPQCLASAKQKAAKSRIKRDDTSVTEGDGQRPHEKTPIQAEMSTQKPSKLSLFQEAKAQSTCRDGLIELLSAAERINCPINGSSDKQNRQRCGHPKIEDTLDGSPSDDMNNMTMTFIDQQSYPGIRRGSDSEGTGMSAGVADDACVQSTPYGMQLPYATWDQIYMSNIQLNIRSLSQQYGMSHPEVMKGYLSLLRYCVHHPCDSTQEVAGTTISRLENMVTEFDWNKDSESKGYSYCMPNQAGSSAPGNQFQLGDVNNLFGVGGPIFTNLEILPLSSCHISGRF